ncbi:hypothetical protein AGOR_G00056860 [Albula goreensis]|uniref:Transmembrane protein TMEM132 cohesin-like domain-containing protein n=1 Tax=Albula goreensis TaxID=1534307 RepID=A0A8T3DVJ0_9TELE|nr:hypothetical protein AGOR_G00056860 [Albula goreensis]
MSPSPGRCAHRWWRDGSAWRGHVCRCSSTWLGGGGRRRGHCRIGCPALPPWRTETPPRSQPAAGCKACWVSAWRSWSCPPPGSAPQRAAGSPAEGDAMLELYYIVQPLEGSSGDCSDIDPQRDPNASVLPGQDDLAPEMQRIGSVELLSGQGEGPRPASLRMDDNVEIQVPASPVKQGQVLGFRVRMSTASTIDQFTLRAPPPTCCGSTEGQILPALGQSPASDRVPVGEPRDNC